MSQLSSLSALLKHNAWLLCIQQQVYVLKWKCDINVLVCTGEINTHRIMMKCIVNPPVCRCTHLYMNLSHSSRLCSTFTMHSVCQRFWGLMDCNLGAELKLLKFFGQITCQNLQFCAKWGLNQMMPQLGGLKNGGRGVKWGLDWQTYPYPLSGVPQVTRIWSWSWFFASLYVHASVYFEV